MRYVRFWIGLGLVLGCLGCRGDGAREKRSERPTLLLYCGAGIQPPVAELAETFGRENNVKVDTDYAGSETLLSTLKVYREGDLYMPGDRHYVEQAASEGLILYRRAVCYFVPTILVPKGNPKGVAGLQDLVKPGVKLGLGDARACAIGRKSKKIFEKNNIPWADVEKNLSFQSMTVNELGVQIQAGSLDAVIVWDAIAHYYSEHGENVPIPAGQNVISTVDIGILKFTKHEALAAKFVSFVASGRGQAIFRKHNYRVDPPGGKGG